MKKQNGNDFDLVKLSLIDDFIYLFGYIAIIEQFLMVLENKDRADVYLLERVVIQKSLGSLKANLEHYQAQLNNEK